MIDNFGKQEELFGHVSIFYCDGLFVTSDFVKPWFSCLAMRFHSCGPSEYNHGIKTYMSFFALGWGIP